VIPYCSAEYLGAIVFSLTVMALVARVSARRENAYVGRVARSALLVLVAIVVGAVFWGYEGVLVCVITSVTLISVAVIVTYTLRSESYSVTPFRATLIVVYWVAFTAFSVYALLFYSERLAEDLARLPLFCLLSASGYEHLILPAFTVMVFLMVVFLLYFIHRYP